VIMDRDERRKLLVGFLQALWDELPLGPSRVPENMTIADLQKGAISQLTMRNLKIISTPIESKTRKLKARWKAGKIVS